jgi:lysophospholipid acyltransferase (LPLAT)-like uncharacterized protein
MSLTKQWKQRLGGLAVYSAVRHWMCTMDFQAIFYDRSVDPSQAVFQGPALFIFWHEYIPTPFYLRPHCNIAMLLSRHRDADWLSQAAQLMGFDTVRGSTRRGGEAALRELFRKSRSMNLAITPDGPRGPRRNLAAGCIFLASRLGIPLVAFGVGYDRPWRVRTWDRFAIPRPYSRVRIMVGPRIWIPADLGRQGIEDYRSQVERTMNRLTIEAEAWAESGQRRKGQVPLAPQPAPPPPPEESVVEANPGRATLPMYGDARRCA